jgi:hypothetical protein
MRRSARTVLCGGAISDGRPYRDHYTLGLHSEGYVVEKEPISKQCDECGTFRLKKRVDVSVFLK